MRFLVLAEGLALHRRVVERTGGLPGVRDLGAVASAVFQPRASAGGADAYPTLIEKAAALGHSLIRSHGFVDGNKRIAHAAMEVFLVLNGREIRAAVDDQEKLMLALAAGEVSRAELVEWLGTHAVALPSANESNQTRC